MKTIILLATILFSSSIFAANVDWSDMELYNRYTLTTDIAFENGITFKAGTQFDMLDFIAEGIPVAYYEMHFTQCKNVDETAEMILVDVPQENAKPVVVGAQLFEGCNLGIYLELKDYFTKSAFSE